MSVSTPNRTRSGSGQPHILVPYGYADHEFATKLITTLRQDRITPWIDDVDMSAGVLLVSRIAHAVRPVDCVIPAISAGSVGSGWVQHDLKTIMTRSFSGRRVPVLPARVDNSALPDFLASQPYVDFHHSGWDVAYDDLIIAISRSIGGPRPAKSELSTFRLPGPASLT
jgi:hypothetical protein